MSRAQERKRINGELRVLRSTRAGYLSGRGLPWGLPWCTKPGGPHCAGKGCDGCAVRGYCHDRADEIARQIEALKSRLAAPTV